MPVLDHGTFRKLDGGELVPAHHSFAGFGADPNELLDHGHVVVMTGDVGFVAADVEVGSHRDGGKLPEDFADELVSDRKIRREG